MFKAPLPAAGFAFDPESRWRIGETQMRYCSSRERAFGVSMRYERFSRGLQKSRTCLATNVPEGLSHMKSFHRSQAGDCPLFIVRAFGAYARTV